METEKGKFNITETIRSIKKAREELRRVVAHEADVCAPLLTDYALLPGLWRHFCELLGRDGSIKADDRKMFIFIVQYLYAPRNLFGVKMPKSLRRELVRAMGVNAVSVVSNDGRSTLFTYQVYTGFRSEVNRIFEGMMERLRASGHIKADAG